MTNSQPPGRAVAGAGNPAAAGAARSRGLVIGRLAGAPIIITPSWVFAALLLTALFTQTVQGFGEDRNLVVTVGVAFTFVLLLFASVLLHEMAHAIVARRSGLEVRELAVTLWGGHTAFSGQARGPGQAALVAVMGPVTNLVLAAGFWAGFTFAPAGSIVRLLCWAAFFSNAFVGVFNLLPGLPLDGGQILEALVWGITGWRTRGTVMAGWVGRLVAVGVAVWALGLPLLRGVRPNTSNLLWMLMIAFFLWQGAGQAIVMGRRREAIAHVNARVLSQRASLIPQGSSIAAVLAVVEAAPDTVPVVIDTRGGAVGWVDLDAADQVPESLAPQTPVESVLVPFPHGSEVPIALTGYPLLEHIDATCAGAHLVPVVDEGGRVLAVLDISRVAQAVRASANTSGRRR